MIPGVLEEITLIDLTGSEFYEIVRSEQYQAAKMVYIDCWTDISRFPLVPLYNCPRFTLKLIGKPADDLKSKFLKVLMKKGKVQKCVLYADSQIMNYFNEPEAMVPDCPSLRRYPIPGTKEYYEIEYRFETDYQKNEVEFVCLERKQ